MSYDSNALSLTGHEANALTVLETTVTIIKEVGSLRQTNEELSRKAWLDGETIANLTDARNALEVTLAETRDALSAALAREAQLRQDYANLATERLDETRRADSAEAARDHVSAELNHTACELAATSIDLDETRAKLTEAEGKLARFREILGLPHPQPEPVSPVQAVPEVETLPNILHFSSTPDVTPEPDPTEVKQAAWPFWPGA